MRVHLGRQSEYQGFKTIVVVEKDFSPADIVELAARGLTPYLVSPSSAFMEDICNLAVPPEEFSYTRDRLRMLFPERPDLETYFRVANVWGWNERKQFTAGVLELKASDIANLDQLNRLILDQWPSFWDRLAPKQKEFYKQSQPLPIEPHKFQAALHYDNDGFCYFKMGGFYFNSAEAIFKIGATYLHVTSANGLQCYSESELIAELSHVWRRSTETGVVCDYPSGRSRFRFDLLGPTTTLTFTVILPPVEVLRPRYAFTYPMLSKRTDVNLNDLVQLCKLLGIAGYSGKGQRALLNYVNEKLPEKLAPPARPGFLFDLEWTNQEIKALAEGVEPLFQEAMALKYLAFTHPIKDNEHYFKKRVVDPLSPPRVTGLLGKSLLCELEDPYEDGMGRRSP